MNKPIKILVLILGIAVVLGTIFWVLRSKPTNPIADNSSVGAQQSLGKVTKSQLPDTDIPPGFPENFPIEVQKKVLENFRNIAENGTTQSARVYLTDKESKTIMNEFRAYLTAYAWVTTEVSASKATNQFLTATKDKQILNLKITPDDKETDKNVVSVYLTTYK
jgi:hypothetical protein